jgi:serine phosphatase RsbU (regulator of sigma subunit)
VAFSDGLIEATGPGGEEFGESGVLSGIRASSGQPAAQVLRRIMNRAVTFVENGEFHDDLTVFVVRLAQNPKSARGSQQDNN